MEAAAVTSAATATGHELLFSVKEEPLDFDMMVKVESDLDLDLSPERKPSIPSTTMASLKSGANNSSSTNGGIPLSTSSTTATATKTSSATTAAAAVPQIGSSHSAFQPYKQQSLTILTNLQRGNVKTTNKENSPESLTFHEKAAKATLTDTDITESTANAKDPNGFTPLMWAAFHGRLSIVQKLIEKGAQLDTYGPEGETALMFAACNGHTEVLTYLLSKGAESDVEDDAGNTALMFASFGNHTDCVVQLLRKGASMSKPNGIGDTPFEIAINKGHLASQYAMEDFLREEIEMSISETTATTTSTTTKLSNNIISNSNCNSNNLVVNASNGHCSSSSSSNSIVLNKHCSNEISIKTEPLQSENGSSTSFNNISASHPLP